MVCTSQSGLGTDWTWHEADVSKALGVLRRLLVTCHEEVPEAAQFLSRRSRRGTFSLADVVAEMQRRGTN
jgi:hypothetical protein